MKRLTMMAALATTLTAVQPTRATDEVWAGELTVDRVVRIDKGALTVRPGTRVTFRGVGRLELVNAQLLADRADFVATDSLTNAFRISATGGTATITGCTFTGLRRSGCDTKTYLELALSFESTALRFERNKVTDVSGLSLFGKADVRGNRFTDCDCGLVARHAAGSVFADNDFDRIRDTAIQIVDTLGLTAHDNRIAHAPRGIHVYCSARNRFERNAFAACKYAFAISHASSNVFAENRFADTFCRYFPDGGPLPGNDFDGCQALPSPARDVEPVTAFVAKARQLYPTAGYADFRRTLLGTDGFDYRPCDALDVPKERVAPTPTTNDVRWCRVPYVRNMRDLGGWNGLRTGRAFRGSYLFKTPDGDVCDETRTAFAELGIRTDLDLRAHAERKWQLEAMTNMAAVGLSPVHRPISAYMRSFTDLRADFREALLVFADERNYPIYFHCKAGADRTGTLAFVLAGLCGASEADLQIDYELTSVGFDRRTRTAEGMGGRNADGLHWMLDTVKSFPGATLRDRFANCAKALWGLDDAQIDAIRRQLGPVPRRIVFRFPTVLP